MQAGVCRLRSITVDRMGHQSETDATSDSEPHQRTPGLPGMRASRVRGVSTRLETPNSRARALLTAINRLEQEHVALLLAVCDLEESSGKSQDAVLRSALDLLLREDLRRTQHALQRASQGTYGICEVCQQPLSRRHLSLLPAITRCWACTARTPREH
jgi:RNA polymerase-binding transcription factor